MAFIVEFICNINLFFAGLVLLTGIILVHLLAYFLDPHGIRLYPGPFLAKFSDAWLGSVFQEGHCSEVVHALHLKYGSFVRLAPNYVSIAKPEALSIVYAHGNGVLKSEFYQSFVTLGPGTMFSTRDRDQHARKRKIVAHIFSMKSVVEFEPQIRTYVAQLLTQWDRLYDNALKGMSGTDGEGGWRGDGGRLWLDCLPWFHYVAFDIVGDLAFGAPFGMVKAAKDLALVPKRPGDAMDSYDTGKEVESEEIPAIHILDGRGEYSTVLGAVPAWWRPIVRQLPWFRRRGSASKFLEGIATVAIAKRLATPTDRIDLLSKLREGRDSNGNAMDKEELTAEALSLLIAGSDTTSHSSCAILYHIARNPHIQEKLHTELDKELGTEDELTATCEQVKRLRYMDACINEGLRIHPTVAIGLPRIVPQGGLTVLGQFFPEGTILSVPTYSVHRDPSIWGEDADVYRPERWFEIDAAAVQKCFNPFSTGPRACIGRNLAVLELQIMIASIMRRYHFVLKNPDEPLQTGEAFLRKSLGCQVGLKRRDL